MTTEALDARAATATHHRLRPAVHVAPVPEGLLFVGWQESMVVHGSSSLWRLWEAMFPHVHRGVDLDQLITALPESARAVAQQVLEQLDARGFFLHEQTGAVGTARGPVHPDHERTLAFLEAAAPDPVRAQERLRTSAVEVRGRGDVAVHAARSLLRLGAGDLTVIDAAARRELAPLADEHGAALRSQAGGTPVITITVDETFTPETGACVGVIQLGDHALVGPLQAGVHDPGVSVALDRVRVRGDAARQAPTPAVAARLAGGLAALQVVHFLCGITTEYEGMTYLVDAERLGTTTHPVWPQGPTVAEPLRGADGPGVGENALEELTNERTGILPPAMPFDLPQTPLALIQTDVDSDVVGWAASGAVARYRVALESARALASTATPRVWTASGQELAPPAMLVSAAGRDDDGMIGHGVQRLLAQILAEPSERARRLVTGTRSRLRLDDVPPPVRSALERLAVRRTVDLVATTSRLVGGCPALAVVELSDAQTGRVLAVVASADEAWAQAAAVDHASATLSVTGQADAVPQLAVPPWAGDGEVSPEPGDVRALLAALCLPGETPVTGRWSLEPALDSLGVVGWVGVAPITTHLQVNV